MSKALYSTGAVLYCSMRGTTSWQHSSSKQIKINAIYHEQGFKEHGMTVRVKCSGRRTKSIAPAFNNAGRKVVLLIWSLDSPIKFMYIQYWNNLLDQVDFVCSSFHC